MPQTLLENKHLSDFQEIHQMIQTAHCEASYQINKVLIRLYWSIGQYVSHKIASSTWGDSVVSKLSAYLLTQQPGIKGFSARNIWRMKQFYETYKETQKLSAALTEITWTNHLHILSKTKSLEEKQFYLELAAKQRCSEREFSRIIDSGTFERTVLGNQKLSAALAEFPADTNNVFKDIYLFEFTGVSDNHRELDLQALLLKHMRKFLMEMGPDFGLIGEQFVVQIGNHDYRIDLLLQHRGLNCLVAIELKTTDFKPEYLGKLQFYLEALDKDVKKAHENPSIGLLICKSKDKEVVEYAMNRSLSPALIAEYETKLIDKAILQQKIHELSETLNNSIV